MKIERMVTVYRCERCDHEWIPRRERKPTICPKCKTPYWDRPRERAPRRIPSGAGTDARIFLPGNVERDVSSTTYSLCDCWERGWAITPEMGGLREVRGVVHHPYCPKLTAAPEPPAGSEGTG